MSSQGAVHVSPILGNTGSGQRGSGHLAVPLAAWWPDSEPVFKPYARGGTSLRVTSEGGVYCEPALQPRYAWEDPQRKSQGFKLDSGDPTVQDYRGASGNVAMVELGTRLAIERARTVTLRLKLARWSSIPTRRSRRTQVNLTRTRLRAGRACPRGGRRAESSA